MENAKEKIRTMEKAWDGEVTEETIGRLSYAWTITSVSNPEDSQAIGVTGPYNTDMTAEEIIRHPDRIKFRLYCDGDPRELVASGWFVPGVVDDYSFSCGDEPLNDFGAYCWGAAFITLQHKNTKAMEF